MPSAAAAAAATRPDYRKVTTPPVCRTVMTRVMVQPATRSQYRTRPTYGTVAQ
jgi:hypothetical protein